MTCFLFCFREKLRELNNELLKKNAFIDEMEPKYNASCKFVECLKNCQNSRKEEE